MVTIYLRAATVATSEAGPIYRMVVLVHVATIKANNSSTFTCIGPWAVALESIAVCVIRFS